MEKTNWSYRGSVINSIDDVRGFSKKAVGFVYLLKLYDIKSGKLKYQYIGKKNLYTNRSKNLTQKELETLPKNTVKRKRRKGKTIYYITVTKESDWKTYCSSNDFIKNNSKKFKIEREILRFCDTDSDLSYREAQEIICQDAMDDPLFLNNGVSIRRFATKVM